MRIFGLVHPADFLLGFMVGALLLYWICRLAWRKKN